jgi:hypothetical protein
MSMGITKSVCLDQLYFTAKDGFRHLPVAAFCFFLGAVRATASLTSQIQ